MLFRSGKPTSITERISTEDVLKNLAQQFQEFTKFKNTKLIEAEEVNALHEEWETGLQDGESEVQLPSDDQEAEGSTECSPPGDGEETGTQYNGGCGSYPSAIEGGQPDTPLQFESSLPPPESFICEK